MTKVAYNCCYGGFGLSHAGVMRYAELKGIKIYAFMDKRFREGERLTKKYQMIRISDQEAAKEFFVHYCTTPEYSNETYWPSHDIGNDRADPILIQTIEELGEKANGQCAEIKIQDIPKGTNYRIQEYDGREWIETRDSIDWNTA